MADILELVESRTYLDRVKSEARPGIDEPVDASPDRNVGSRNLTPFALTLDDVVVPEQGGKTSGSARIIGRLVDEHIGHDRGSVIGQSTYRYQVRLENEDIECPEQNSPDQDRHTSRRR